MSVQFSRLKMFRKQSGFTQEEIAEKLGVSRQAVAKWEKGETLPDIESCIQLADIYGTTETQQQGADHASCKLPQCFRDEGGR